MTTDRTHETFLGFLKRHERPLATGLFIFGFITDLVTFGFLDIPSVTILFAVYLAIVVILTSVAHVTHGREETTFIRSVAVLSPLLAQFTFGSLLSGFVIFYTKSAVLSVSWPFLLLLLIIFFGNEVFRNYRSHLIFQTLLLYFSLYAFALFALPVYTGRIGTSLFLGSTILTIATFAVYLLILRLLSWQRLREALLPIVLSVTAMTSLIVGAYLAGILPPLPLTLKAGGVYHEITHTEGEYVAKTEGGRVWFDPRTQVVQHVPGTPLYAYSAIFAPGSFSTSVVHVWQRYDSKEKEWNTESTVAFSLSGGRAGGYRGYSLKYDPAPGEWRVLVQTLNGQTIGKLRFTVENADSQPQVTSVSL